MLNAPVQRTAQTQLKDIVVRLERQEVKVLIRKPFCSFGDVGLGALLILFLFDGELI
jgi:hypothetical protein